MRRTDEVADEVLQQAKEDKSSKFSECVHRDGLINSQCRNCGRYVKKLRHIKHYVEVSSWLRF